MPTDRVGLSDIDDGGKELSHRKSRAAQFGGYAQPAESRLLEKPDLIKGILVVQITVPCSLGDLGEQIPVGVGAGQRADFQD